MGAYEIAKYLKIMIKKFKNSFQPQICLRDRDSAYKPINLYHKVGHGKLDMYVINPSKDAKEIREFMERWNGENSKSLGKNFNVFFSQIII